MQAHDNVGQVISFLKSLGPHLTWASLVQGLGQIQGPGSGPGESAGAGSPFTDYTAGVVMYLFIIAILVAVLLMGAFIVLTFGLLSRRPQDHVGSRNPSDIGLLKSNNWPQVPYEEVKLPAEEQGQAALAQAPEPPGFEPEPDESSPGLRSTFQKNKLDRKAA